MKKKIERPENWQDFEDLCKNLWGEIWEIPNIITKNGRLGQSQHGVDISGIPSFTNKYWGIQCKDKDSYTKAKLSEKEIIKEVEKAKLFKPDLDVYIIASTATKDAKIEQFVRVLNLKNIEENLFRIILFSWEDIVDLLYKHPKVLKWYHGLNHWDKFDFKVSYNDFIESLIIKPQFKKEITKYVITDKSLSEIIAGRFNQNKDIFSLHDHLFPKANQEINKSWVTFEIVLENCGSVVIEDWYFKIKFTEGVKKIYKGSGTIYEPLDLTKDIDNDLKKITYSPLRSTPLVQKDNEYFEISILPEINATKIVAEWEIIARDFNKEGISEILVEPEYVEVVEYEELEIDASFQDDKVEIRYLIEKDTTARPPHWR